MLDVLDMLPLDVLADNIWNLLPHASTCSLKLACRQARLLADQLTTSVLNITSEADQTLGLQRAAQCMTFLARLPHLTRVALRDWPDEASLITTVEEVGVATQGRIRHLQLCGWHLSASGMHAISRALPRLRTVSLTPCCSTEFYDDDELALTGTLFDHHPGLTQVSVQDHVSATPDVLRSLSSLSRLLQLDLVLTALHPPDLHPLSALYHLRRCSLWADTVRGRDALNSLWEFSIVDAAPLLASSHLTSLSLGNVDTDVNPHDAQAVSQLPAALLQLGALAQLRSLYLGRRLVVTDLAFSALQRLTQLTKLRTGRICLSTTTTTQGPWGRREGPGGHLPLLQELRVFFTQPAWLLDTLLPLHPLKALTTWGRDGDLELDLSYHEHALDDLGRVSGSEVHVQAAAVGRVTWLLRQAPGLRLSGALRLHRQFHDGVGPNHLRLVQVARDLRPLSECFEDVTLDGLKLTRGWWGGRHAVTPNVECMGACMPHLRTLRLVRCELYDLAGLVSSLPSLEELFMEGCAAIGQDGWDRLAGQDCHGLRLSLTPSLPSRLVRRCSELQWGRYGAGSIRWVQREAEVLEQMKASLSGAEEDEGEMGEEEEEGKEEEEASQGSDVSGIGPHPEGFESRGYDLGGQESDNDDWSY